VGERIRVETELPDEAVPLRADQGQITQVVMNLAVNARDAMPEGGALRIGLRCAGRPSGPPLPDEALHADRFAVLTVSDTGSGIDPAIRPRIFDPFFTTKPVGEGTGLGLSTVYGIVMQLAGTLRVRSDDRQGTSIEVYLPLAAPTPAPEALAQALAGAPGAVGRTVLLAEDEPGLRQMVERVLKSAGYRVLAASDGVDALEMSRAHVGPIELLVADVVMPRLGGIDLAAAILAERPRTRVLMMSGYSRDSDAPAALSQAPFLAKPFSPAELLAAASAAIDAS
jgi:CheY-like chemotaxis protein